MLIISPTATISRFADIEDSVRGSRIIIGDDVKIDSFVKIKPAGGSGDCTIGDGTVLNAGVTLYTGNGITIGKHVLVAANCVFSAASHEYHRRDRLIKEQGFIQGRHGIVVEDDVWFGANCVVLEGAHVKTGVVVGAGSIVKGTLEDYGIYTGSPLLCVGHRR